MPPNYFSFYPFIFHFQFLVTFHHSGKPLFRQILPVLPFSLSLSSHSLSLWPTTVPPNSSSISHFIFSLSLSCLYFVPFHFSCNSLSDHGLFTCHTYFNLLTHFNFSPHSRQPKLTFLLSGKYQAHEVLVSYSFVCTHVRY